MKYYITVIDSQDRMEKVRPAQPSLKKAKEKVQQIIRAKGDYITCVSIGSDYGLSLMEKWPKEDYWRLYTD